jgi:hypothetical protein
MPAVSILSLALGLAFLSGINLYLTTFLAGLASRMGWLDAMGLSGSLPLVSHPAVMTVAFLLFLLEAFVDKVPWVDSLWDALHTVIRPAGAVLLALEVMGNADPAYRAAAGILAGLAGLTTHMTKAGLRLLINTTPEPLSNILTSIAEDIAVAGIFALLLLHPLAGLITCVSLVVILWMLLPKLFRLMKANLYLMWKKLRLPGGSERAKAVLTDRITAEQDMLLHSQLSGPVTVTWAVPCVTGKVRGFPNLLPNTFGTLVSTREHPGALVFLSRRWFRHSAARLSLPGCDAQHESSFLSESLVIYSKADKRVATFRFTRGHDALAAQLQKDISRRIRSGASDDAPPILLTPAQEIPAALPDAMPVTENATVIAAEQAPAVPAETAPNAPAIPAAASSPEIPAALSDDIFRERHSPPAQPEPSPEIPATSHPATIDPFPLDTSPATPAHADPAPSSPSTQPDQNAS